jgi:hypothetical protein
MNRHLNEEEVLSWVSGERCKSSAEHVTSCAECRNEVERLGAVLGGFRVSTHDWAEQTRQKVVPLTEASWMAAARLFGRRNLQWGAALALLVVCFGVVMTLHHGDKPRGAITTGAADDAVLERVNTAMSREVPSAMEPLSQLVPTERGQKTEGSN